MLPSFLFNEVSGSLGKSVHLACLSPVSQAARQACSNILAFGKVERRGAGFQHLQARGLLFICLERCAAGSQIVCALPRDVGRLVVCQQGPPPPNPLVVERFQQVISQLFQQARRPACAAPWSAMERRQPKQTCLVQVKVQVSHSLCCQLCVLLQVLSVICCDGSELFSWFVQSLCVMHALMRRIVLLQIDSRLQTAPVRLRTAAEAPPLTRAARAADRAHGRAGG
jgi:hypothetical protein